MSEIQTELNVGDVVILKSGGSTSARWTIIGINNGIAEIVSDYNGQIISQSISLIALMKAPLNSGGISTGRIVRG